MKKKKRFRNKKKSEQRVVTVPDEKGEERKKTTTLGKGRLKKHAPAPKMRGGREGRTICKVEEQADLLKGKL